MPIMGMLEGRAAVVGRPVGVPAGADLNADSTGRTEFTADSDGNVWVVDAVTNRVIYDAPMLRGERLVINPEGNRIRLNTTRGGNQVYDRDLSGAPIRQSGTAPATVACSAPARSGHRDRSGARTSNVPT